MDDLNRSNERDAATGVPETEAARDARRVRAEERRVDDLRRESDAGDEIGEAVGGISGVLTGAALGSLGGPLGTIIGGIAGAVSGWWAGRAIAEAASHVTNEDEDYYRTHYERSTGRLGDRSYEQVRPAYQLGHLAGRNPEYADRPFEEVEADLRRGWSKDVSARLGPWEQVRDYARHAFDRGRRGFGIGAVAGSARTSEREFDRVSDSPAGGTGYGASAGGPTRAPNASDAALGAPESVAPDATSDVVRAPSGMTGSATGGASLGGPAHDTSAAEGGASASDSTMRIASPAALDRASSTGLAGTGGSTSGSTMSAPSANTNAADYGTPSDAPGASASGTGLGAGSASGTGSTTATGRQSGTPGATSTGSSPTTGSGAAGGAGAAAGMAAASGYGAAGAGSTDEGGAFDRARDVGEHLRDRAADALHKPKDADEQR